MAHDLFISTFSVSELETALKKVLTEILENRHHLQPSHDADELITREETAKILRVTLPTLHNWTKRGLIPHYKVSSRVRYKRNEVMNLFTSGKLNKFGRH